MTAITANRSDAGIYSDGPARRIGSWTAQVRQSLADQRALRTTRNELSALSDRRLRDVGLTRDGVDAAALAAVRGR